MNVVYVSMDEVFLTAGVRTITNYDLLPESVNFSSSAKMLDFNSY